MVFALCYFVVRVILRIASTRDVTEREAEILVLRHQIAVLKGANRRLRLRRAGIPHILEQREGEPHVDRVERLRPAGPVKRTGRSGLDGTDVTSGSAKNRPILPLTCCGRYPA